MDATPTNFQSNNVDVKDRRLSFHPEEVFFCPFSEREVESRSSLYRSRGGKKDERKMTCRRTTPKRRGRRFFFSLEF